jgi:nicotinamide phosphoribosyltransferase
VESAAIGGAAHLVNFMGTDTLPAIELLMACYNTNMPGFSIPAAEHSTITTWGKEGEERAYKNMLEQYPTGLVAVVSDSWDIRNAVAKIWGQRLREQVISRDGVLVIRPDSGEPRVILPELFDLIGANFGAVKNEKGYKVIHHKVRVIQGDGINRRSLAGILDAGMDRGWSADCLSFGSGGGLLQDCNRDVQRFAMKCSYVEVAGAGQDVFKQPVTDPTKNSKRGRLMLAQGSNFQTIKGTDFATLPQGTPGYADVLEPAFRDGELLRDENLEEIRKRAVIQ